MDLGVISGFISSVGFPIFIAIYMIKIFTRLLHEEQEHTAKLSESLSELNRTISSWNKNQEVQMESIKNIIEKLDAIIESNIRISTRLEVDK